MLIYEERKCKMLTEGIEPRINFFAQHRARLCCWESMWSDEYEKVVYYTWLWAVNDVAPSYIKDLFFLRATLYDLRGSRILSLPRCNTTSYGLKSIRYSGPNLSNSLKDNIRLSQDLSSLLVCSNNNVPSFSLNFSSLFLFYFYSILF